LPHPYNTSSIEEASRNAINFFIFHFPFHFSLRFQFRHLNKKTPVLIRIPVIKDRRYTCGATLFGNKITHFQRERQYALRPVTPARVVRYLKACAFVRYALRSPFAIPLTVGLPAPPALCECAYGLISTSSVYYITLTRHFPLVKYLTYEYRFFLSYTEPYTLHTA
jgi:hypothetical protein